MEPNTDTDKRIRNRKLWVIILCICFAALSAFWSVDRSIAYMLLGVAAFSLFRIMQLRPGSDAQSQTNQSYSDRDYQSSTFSRPAPFWQDVQAVFGKNSAGPQTPQQAKMLVIVVVGFISFVFLIIILGVVAGGDSAEDGARYYQQATDYFNNQQYDSAAYYYKLALAEDPENADLYFECGNAFLNANRTDSALIMYDNALALYPQYESAQYNKGYIYFHRKSYRQAIDETRKIMEYNPDNTNAMLLIGDSFYNQSQLDSALGWYEGAYARGYRSAILCHLMAYIYDVKGETGKAVNLYKEAIGQDSSITDIYVRLGEIVQGEEGNWYRVKAARMR